MAIDENNEIELKFRADEVDAPEFIKWAMGYLSPVLPITYFQINCTDNYYKQNDNIVRYRRQNDGIQQLTVKKRKSPVSTQDRIEVDLELANSNPKLVNSFLLTSGFSHKFTLYKDEHILYFVDGIYESVLSLYYVNCGEGSKRHCFVEIEIKKGTDIAPDTAKKYLRKWKASLTEKFKVELVNYSLYEFYDQEKPCLEKV